MDVQFIKYPNAGRDGKIIKFPPDPSSGTGSGPASGKYRADVYALDGVGGFDWVVDSSGEPIYVLADLE